MNGWGFLVLSSSIVAVFSLPLVLFVGLRCLDGRVSKRALAAVLAAVAVLWALAAILWWGRAGG